MKKILTIIILAICTMTMMAEDRLREGNLYYEIIPINGGYSAKIVAHRSYKKLDSINIPECITYQGVDLPIIIDNQAFYGYKKLSYVSIPESVIGIGCLAFEGTALYNNPDNWHNGALCIDGCLIRASRYIPKDYEIGDDVRLIADAAFEHCDALTSITIPNSVTSIGWDAFNGCYSLTSVTIPESVTSIGSRAFYGCKSLNTVTILKGVTSIAESAFSGCTSLTSVTIPNSVTSIGGHAFWDCSSLTSVTIPNSVKWIGVQAFKGCKSLTSVTIPNSVTSIGSDAFPSHTKIIRQ